MPDTAGCSLKGVHKDGIKEAVLKPPCFAVKGIILSGGWADRWFTGAPDLPAAYEGKQKKDGHYPPLLLQFSVLIWRGTAWLGAGLHHE